MNFQVSADNRAGITRGGARNVYTMAVEYISRISTSATGVTSRIKGAGLAISNQASAGKEWKFPSECQVENSIIEAAGGSEILAKLLVKRGLRTPAEVTAFLDPSVYSPSSPAELPDMPRAVERIFQAIANKEKITVYGDYDVDGVTATAVMVTTLRKLGADVDYYIPTRAEGYGLNLKAVSVLASKHRTKLIVTCDCGISNFSEINFARSLGVESIVVDHHTMPELLPPAAAILHPKQLNEDHPLYHLPGVGVAYKLAEALLIEKDLSDEVPRLLDFVTLGMIADMVPLTQECRYLVQIGMPWLVNSKRAGIRALLEQVGGRGESTDLVGFGLAPRINAVGRLSDANLAVKLMITDDEGEAGQLAKQLELENARRQELCEQIFAKADQVASQNVRAGHRAIAIYDSGWHHGVVGIVASRLVEKYHCPVFIGELDPAEGIVKGSARGIAGIDLYEVLKANEHLALKWGGHKMAAGFSVEAGKAELFCKGIVETCNRLLAEQYLRPTLDIDLEVQPEDVCEQLANTLSKLAPFGMANKKPVVALRKQQCAGTRPLGRDGKHARVMVATADGRQLECVFWNTRGRIPQQGETIDIAFTPEMNFYNGTARLQLVLNDWRDPRRPEPVMPVPASVDGRTATTGSRAPEATAAGGTANAQAVTGQATATGKGEFSAQPSTDAPATAKTSADERLDFSPAPTRLTWKDLRNHAAPESLIHAAIRKLGSGAAVFAEACPKIAGVEFVDRAAAPAANHILFWHYPPSAQILKSVLANTGATNVYLIGGAPDAADDAPGFLRKLLGIVRFAVNQKDGQAEPERVAAALGSTKMNLALGLTILKKINLIDWFSEDGCLYLDLIGEATEKPEQLPEFRQLANGLKEVSEFRKWCHQAAINELQLAFVPVAEKKPQAAEQAGVSHREEQAFSGTHSNDTANQFSSNL